ncbi:MAG: response regulator [Chloroflexota bacterium]
MNESDTILLVENDQVDIMTVRRVMRDLKIRNRLETALNGEEALDRLNNKSLHPPAMILLDLNMPRMSGLEFLEIAKKDDDLKSIPVVVLTTSKEKRDRRQSFDHSIAGYIVKPVDYNEFLDTFKIIYDYWNINELPE